MPAARMLHEAPAISLMRNKGGGSKDNLDSAPEAWLEWLERAPVNVKCS